MSPDLFVAWFNHGWSIYLCVIRLEHPLFEMLFCFLLYGSEIRCCSHRRDCASFKRCPNSPALESIVVVGVLANPTFHFGQRLWRRSDEALYGGMYVYYIWGILSAIKLPLVSILKCQWGIFFFSIWHIKLVDIYFAYLMSYAFFMSYAVNRLSSVPIL